MNTLFNIGNKIISGGQERYVFDTYKPYAGYSLRKLSSNSGDVIRVRREVDNAEIDLTSDEIINGQLETFATEVSNSNVYVTTWYDQFGSNHALQSSASLQPKIWDASTGLVLRNNVPALYFDSDFFEIPQSQNKFRYFHNGQTSTTFYQTAFGFVTNPEDFYHVFGNNGGNKVNKGVSVGFDDRSAIGGRNNCQNVYVTRNDLRIVLDVIGDFYTPAEQSLTFLLIDADNEISQLRSLSGVNGHSLTGLNLETNSTIDGPSSYNMQIGSDGNGNFPMEGYMQEIIFFDSNQLSSRSIIEKSMNNYYLPQPDFSVSGLLHDHLGASAAYSLRQLKLYNNNYQERIIRVRRDSDNFETDVYADSNFYAFTLDSPTSSGLSFSDFIGSDNGYLVAWYDQSGNGKHAKQVSAANQPKIYDSVTGIFKDSGILAIPFDGVSTYLEIISNITGEDFSVFTSFRVNSQDPAEDGYIFDNLTSYGRALYHDDYFSGRMTLQSDTSSTNAIRVRSNIDTNLNVISGIINNNSIVDGSVAIYRNGVLEDSFAGDVPYEENTFPQYIGAGSGSPNEILDGQINELIIYTNKNITEPFRLSIENDITSYANNIYFTDNYAPIDGNEFEWNGLTYKVIVKNGLAWLDRNLGATRAATELGDPQAFGDLYQWGRLTDGHEKRNSGTTLTLSTTDVPITGDFILKTSSPFDWRNPQNDNLWQGENGINNPAPPGWRLPTLAEWQTELASWGSGNLSGAYNSQLKLVAAGARSNSNGSLYDVGLEGRYWSSTVDGTFASYLNFYSSTANMSSDYRAGGFSVRCVRTIV